MSVKRISLRFNLDNADDRRAWEALHRLGSRSINREIITRINAKEQEDSLKDCIRQIISDELSKVISGGFVQQLPLVEEEETSNELWGHNSFDRGCRPYDPAEKGRFCYETNT